MHEHIHTYTVAERGVTINDVHPQAVVIFVCPLNEHV